MKTDAILFRLLVACGAVLLALAPPGARAQAAQPVAPPGPQPQLIDASPTRCSGASYRGRVPQVQIELNRIFAADPQFRKDAGAGANPLRDGILGPVTRKWLGVFCQRHPFKARAAAFDADVAAKLAGFRPAPQPLPPAPIPEAPLPGIETTWRYDPKALRKPRDASTAVARLRLLTDRYADKVLFEGAVRRALKGLVVDAPMQARIEEFSRVDGYRLTSEKLGQVKGLPAGLRAMLEPGAGIDFASVEEFHLNLEAAVGDDGAAKAELASLLARIDEKALVPHYQVPDTIGADLAAAAEMEPVLADFYLPVAMVEFPSQHLLVQALRARAQRALGMCRLNHLRQDGRIDADNDIKAVWALVEPDMASFDTLAKLRARTTRCDKDELAQVQGLVGKAHKALYAKLESAAVLMKVNRAPPLAKQGGPGAAAGCGCAHDAHEGMTYGFYPLWTDGDAERLDFDVLSRIGLYGMTIDDKGGLRYPAGVQTPPWTLLQAAHRHMTKVDWVLYKNDWSAASDSGMNRLLDNLRASIATLLQTRFPRTDWSGTALATFGLEQGPSIGDGVTLRFERFPSGRQNQEALREFVQLLAADLRQMKPARKLNFMVTQDEILGADGTGTQDAAFSAVNLLGLTQQANYIENDDDPADSRRMRAEDVKVLVLMPEPTTSQKLELRAGIENALFSSNRVRMLRNVIPIVEYDAGRDMMLTDDIVYFQDNFGGIGFWPLPFASAQDEAEGSATANHVLHAYFKRIELEGGVKATLIDLICPNRAWLRWLAWISSIVAIVAGVTLARCRGCGTRLDKNKLYMAGMVALLVLPFIVIAALVVGDPLFKSDSGVHWFVAALLIGVVIVPGAYGLLKPERQLP